MYQARAGQDRKNTFAPERAFEQDPCLQIANAMAQKYNNILMPQISATGRKNYYHHRECIYNFFHAYSPV